MKCQKLYDFFISTMGTCRALPLAFVMHISARIILLRCKHKTNRVFRKLTQFTPYTSRHQYPDIRFIQPICFTSFTVI